MSSYGAKGSPTSRERKTMSNPKPPDNPRVLVHPPAVYAAGLLTGWGLQRFRAWPFVSGEGAALALTPCIQAQSELAHIGGAQTCHASC